MAQTLGKRIMENRKRLSMTQDQLAEKLGVTPQAVSKWENDQSCPDISILPQLADIFGITIDALLGRAPTEKVHNAEVVTEEDDHSSGLHIRGNNISFILSNSKFTNILIALYVISVGILYLSSHLFQWSITLWQIIWTTAMIFFGISGFYPKFSFVRLVIGGFGVYHLLNRIFHFPVILDGGIVIAACIFAIGLTLFINAVRNPNKSFLHIDRGINNDEKTQQLNIDETTFDCRSSFGSCTQPIDISLLEYGNIECSFGEYTVDLSGVENVSENCTIDAKCACGELRILIPDYYCVKQSCSTALAEIAIKGQPSINPKGTIYINAKASMGEIIIEYI